MLYLLSYGATFLHFAFSFWKVSYGATSYLSSTEQIVSLFSNSWFYVQKRLKIAFKSLLEDQRRAKFRHKLRQLLMYFWQLVHSIKSSTLRKTKNNITDKKFSPKIFFPNGIFLKLGFRLNPNKRQILIVLNN